MRIAVIGIGSLGTIVGALMTRAGLDVELVDADPENVSILNRSGATITGALDANVKVKALGPADMRGLYDMVILLTKQVHNQNVLDQLEPRLHATSTVCTLQNGIPEESVAARIGAARTVGGTVGFGATWGGPGQSTLTSTLEALERYGFDVGEIDGRITDRIKKLQAVLATVGGCMVVDNLMAIRWSKLLMNATFSGMSAALGCRFGDVLDDPTAMEALSHIADETIKVAHACGRRLAHMQDEDMEFLELRPGETVADKMDFYRRVWTRHAALKASMLQDLEKGRTTEIDFINGYVCSKGAEHGVPTPFNDFVVERVRQAQSARKVPSFGEGLPAFRALLTKLDPARAAGG
jgi:2-dehydropantoate 2-reductase